MKLDKIGKAYVRALKMQMENLGTYQKGDETLMLNDIGLQYQLYKIALEKSLLDEESQKLAMNAHRHYNNVMNALHKLQLTPAGRKGVVTKDDDFDNGSEIGNLTKKFNN